MIFLRKTQNTIRIKSKPESIHSNRRAGISAAKYGRHGRAAHANQRRDRATGAPIQQEGEAPVKTPEPPEDVSDGLYTAVETDGRVKFILARRKKPVGQITLAANEAGQMAANALRGAFEAFDKAAMGLVPPGERKASYPFVRITGLGLGPCPIE